MKISIITAVFNNQTNISECLESVKNQTYENIEHIVIDGGSTDKTLEIINSHRDNIGKIISEPDKGIYDALNKGIKNATGEIIGFLHSDDLFFNNQVIKKVIDTFRANKCDVVYGDLIYVSRNDVNKTIRNWKSCSFDKKLLKKGWMPPHPTMFVKREIYNTYGLFNTDYRIAADYDFILRVMGSGNLKCEYIGDIITKMRVGGASNKSLKNIWRKSKEDLMALRVNKIGGILTLFRKNFSKVKQFI